ncbi:MAG: adenosylmethionine decarboxylase [Elusimicrobia bacterium]|nr:adenosylmethionine decarboxylase [Elusimicrobiota bacterium]
MESRLSLSSRSSISNYSQHSKRNGSLSQNGDSDPGSLGRHLIIELYECDPKAVGDVQRVENTMTHAAKAIHAKIVDVVFHSFNPQGISGVVVIAESHLAIHTWPEYHYAAVDIFTCGRSIDPWKAYPVLKREFKAKRMKAMELKRGVLKA